MNGVRVALGRASIVLLIVAGVGGCPALARADDPPAASLPAWVGQVSLSGIASASYGYNFNRPSSATNQLRVFDFDDDTFKLDQLELVAQHAVSKPRESGFRADIGLGGSVPRVTAAADPSRAGLPPADIDVHQAFVSYIAPVGSGLRFDAGKFVTHHGYEVIDGPDGWNDNATRGLLFGYAIPFAHVGVRASFTPTPPITAMLMLVNGWDNARDNNRTKTVGWQIAVRPHARVTVSLNGLVGSERNGDDHSTRRLFDVVVIARPMDALSLAANRTEGSDRSRGPYSIPDDWNASAVYARLACGWGFAMAVRGEYFEDTDGARTGTGQTLREFTLTPEQRLTPHLLVRGDFRIDRSDRRVFEKLALLVKTQPTVLLSALYSF